VGRSLSEAGVGSTAESQTGAHSFHPLSESRRMGLPCSAMRVPRLSSTPLLSLLLASRPGARVDREPHLFLPPRAWLYRRGPVECGAVCPGRSTATRLWVGGAAPDCIRGSRRRRPGRRRPWCIGGLESASRSPRARTEEAAQNRPGIARDLARCGDAACPLSRVAAHVWSA